MTVVRFFLIIRQRDRCYFTARYHIWFFVLVYILNRGNRVSEGFRFQNFPGGMTPGPLVKSHEQPNLQQSDFGLDPPLRSYRHTENIKCYCKRNRYYSMKMHG